MKTPILTWILLLAIQPIEAIENENFNFQNDYVGRCELQGITIPTKDQLNCEDGNLIRIFQTTCKGGKLQKKEITSKNYTADTECDNPAHLVSSCTPGSRYKLIKSKKKSDRTLCVLLCRKIGNPNDPKYDDINLICHNPINGASCFFNSDIGSHSGKLNRPGKGAPWAPTLPTLGCVSCHDNDPFILTPYLKDLKKELYQAGWDPNGPYYPVANPYLDQDPYEKAMIPLEYLANDISCTQCHRIGQHMGCEKFVPMSVDRSKNYKSAGTECKKIKQHWMPPGRKHADPTEVALIEKCCAAKRKGESPKECQWKRIPGWEKRYKKYPPTWKSGLGIREWLNKNPILKTH